LTKSKPAPVPKISKFKSLNQRLASRYEKPNIPLNPASNRSDPPVSNSFRSFEKDQLTPEELKIYGERFPDGYTKIKLLGKGSKSMVWAANSTQEGLVAIK
jgi:hypothetical protein